MVEVGLTEKLAAPAAVPIGVPPEGTVNHVIVYDEFAVKVEELAQFIVEGVASGLVGTGKTVTVTVIETAVDVPQNEFVLA